eukprot:CAMPEP_0168220332 /NCGR_PEP_ID=MMETSP0140_2-20121125/9161_1 /TAXON_ID=44445 /ORGANISM="Pseudo-nitzschia australis, Strain 10249 10 AB" /LENGTH=239 /DNA_ID=CAMNT_0008149021 /DNA_START=37 /DNA_END=756 /DNA_ORIENTATION=-
MSKPRPGVAAAKRLSKCTDPKVWGLVESQYSEIVPHVKGLKDTQREYKKIGRLLSNENMKSVITKEELLSVVSWKFSVGKPRHALMKHLKSNTEASVREHSTAGIAEARGAAKSKTEETKKALGHFINLKGVGPATASAVLTLVQPDKFAYMYDEVINCFLPERTYTLPTYMAVNENCLSIAKKLGDGWTTSRVATVLWTAARVNAYDLHDHTLSKRPMVNSADETIIEKRRISKRRKC